jgi:hypothetical protein
VPLSADHEKGIPAGADFRQCIQAKVISRVDSYLLFSTPETKIQAKIILQPSTDKQKFFW